MYIHTSYITRNLAMAAVCKVSFHDSLNTTPFEGKAMHTTCQLCNHVTFSAKGQSIKVIAPWTVDVLSNQKHL